MLKLGDKLSKENKKLEIRIIEFKDYIEFLKNSNKVLRNEIDKIRR